MPYKFFAIITNTFTETLRQPIFGIMVISTILVLILCPSLAMFTLEDDNQLLKDIGLSTIMLAGMLLAVFAATSVVSEEIENKTALTVISKTVGRGMFVLGKFIGIVGAVILAEYLLCLVLLMVIRHGVMQDSADKHDSVIMTLGSVGLGLTFLISLAGNYFYKWRFSSTTIITGGLLATIVILLLYLLDPHWKVNPAENHLQWNILAPMALTIISVIIMTAIAVAAAIRFNLITTLVFCCLIFVLGAILENWLGPVARAQSGLASYLAWAVLAVVPNISFSVVTNTTYQGTPLPLDYIAQVALYAFFYVTACLLFAIILFRTREIG
ncbi:MAG: hypothetical protein JXD22_04680 [Sedimentisphaerales bacterium]|nr:hypothetical protein [Sedimentisphaerales bacterium]